MPTATRILAELALRTPSDTVSASARGAARKMILDTLGCAIAGYDSEGVAACLAAARDRGGREQAGVLVYGDRLPVPEAAFVNGVMIHALDYDDVHVPGSLHLMSSMLPVALAIGESTGAAGREIVDAVILGVEVSGRLGRACREHWHPVQAAGYLPSSIIGGFGATAGACRLMGLTVDQTVSAFGLFYAQASGNRQGLYDKTLTKRLQPAFAARAALWSADLAQRGITGPPNAIEGEAGLVRVVMNSRDPIDADALRQPGDRWEIQDLTVKQFTSCGGCHPIARAALDLAIEEDLDPSRIEHVAIYVGEGGNLMVGMPFELGDTPQVNAQFCSSYSAAVGLLRRRAGLAEFTSEQIRNDKAVADLAQRVEILTHHDAPPAPDPLPRGVQAWAGKPHGLFVTLRDGRRLERWCSPARVLNPDALDWDGVVAKFRECSDFSGICPPGDANRIIDAVAHLHEAADANALLAACRLGRSDSAMQDRLVADLGSSTL